MDKKSKIKNIYQLSSLQEGMLFHYLKDPKTTAYMEQVSFELIGEINEEVFRESFYILVNRHDSLKTIFNVKSMEQPVQVVLNDIEPTFHYIDLSYLDNLELEKKIEEYLKVDLNNTFDLTKQILMRLSLLKRKDQSYQVVWTHHHIIVDGWSMGILMKEFFIIYHSLLHNIKVPLEKAKEYSQYIKVIKKENIEEATSYWSNYLRDYNSNSNLPYMNENVISEAYEVAEYKYNLDENLTRELVMFSKKHNVTLNTLIQSIWGVMLQKYNDTNDILFGSVVSGRSLNIEGIDSMVGMFINTIPVRVKTNDDYDFISLLSDVNSMNIECKKYDYVSLSEVQNKNNEINHILIFENYPFDAEVSNFFQEYQLNLSIKNVTMCSQTNYDLNLYIIPGKELLFHFNYNMNKYCKDGIVEYIKHFIHIAKTITRNPQIRIKDITLLDKYDIGLLYQFTDTANYYVPSSVVDLWHEQVLKTPNKTALVFHNRYVSFKELNESSNQVAHYLLNTVGSGKIIAILADRSVEMMIALYGILKSGNAYLPIDVEYPKERILYMLENSNSSVLLLHTKTYPNIKFSGEMLYVSSILDTILIKENPQIKIDPKSLAYVMYTSGSTGKPKGVMIEHKALHNFINGITERITFTPDKRIVSLTTISFDIFGLEGILSLVKGLTVVIADEEEQRDPIKFGKLITEHKVNMIQTTPSRMKLFLSEPQIYNCFQSISEIMIGGESFPAGLLNELKEVTNAKIFNMYGPTETTIWSSIDELTDKNDITIGKPIDNTTIYILDRDRNMQPIGVVGDLYIGGDGVARGYYGNDTLTKERFMKSPFINDDIIYKTGDKAMWRKDGNIVYLGRDDGQVKVRGHRIELSEIETCINEFESILASAVIIKNDGVNGNYICAFFVSDNAINNAELKRFMKEKLPDYMIPSFIQRLDALPLLPNGKTDRKALQNISTESNMRIQVMPENDTENKLVQIMSEVLNITNIGVMDNFFEMGGHSIKATRYMVRINRTFGIQLYLKDIYQYPTIRELAKRILSYNKNEVYNMVECNRNDNIPMTSMQKNIYLLSQQNIGTSYNMSSAIKVKGKIDIPHLQNTIKILMNKQQSLRTSFHYENNEFIQRVNLDVHLPFYMVDLSNVPTESIEEIVMREIKPFAMEEAPLFRITLFILDDNNYIILFDIHHIIADGISINLFIKNFLYAYAYNDLPDLKYQYKDYAVWQEYFKTLEAYKRQKEYWNKIFIDKGSILNIPTDMTRDFNESYGGESIEAIINSNQVALLKEYCKQNNTTLFTLLLSCYYVLLSKYTGQTDVVVGTPIANRQLVETEDIIGLFLNMLPLRFQVDGNDSFQELLCKVKDMVTEGFENKDYMYEDLVTELNLPKVIGRNPLFDTMLVLHNYEEEKLEVFDLDISPYNITNNTTKLDIALQVYESDTLKIVCEYNNRIFHKVRMHQFLQFYMNILNNITRYLNEEISVNQISLMNHEEIEEVLHLSHMSLGKNNSKKTVIDLLEEQAALYPKDLAVIFEEKYITYGELNERANALARKLLEKGLQRNQVVAILADRSIDIFVGVYGILKAGGAYLPLDKDYPKDRLSYMLCDSESQFLLCNVDMQIDFQGEVINIAEFNGDNQDTSNLNVPIQSDDLAYIIYTSGSTGKPKGVMINHSSVNNFIHAYGDMIEYTKTKKIISLTSMAFDMFGKDLLVGIAHGLTIVLANQEQQRDPKEFERLTRPYNNLILCTTPSRIKLFLTDHTVAQCFIKMSDFVIGGEILSKELLQELKLYTNGNVFNSYGPTEATVTATMERIAMKSDEKNIKITIGKPVRNVSIYILDEHDQLQPTGVSGEICIGGAGVSTGYRNNEEMTIERFKKNPYIEKEFLYKSGDMARWSFDGKIEFEGRRDNQVKIRGYRIGLGEIEACIKEYKDVKECIVTVKKDSNENEFLCAYITTETTLDFSMLKQSLAKKLPNYMIPSYFKTIDNIPLTVNGKLDVEKLPIPDINDVVDTYKKPRNLLEEQIVEIMSNVLQLQKIGISDNFFNMGGHSLNAANFIYLLNKELNLSLSLKTLFTHSTTKELAEYIQSSTDNVFDEKSYTFLKTEYNLNYFFISTMYKDKPFHICCIEENTKHSTNYLYKLIKREVVENSSPNLIVRYDDVRGNQEMEIENRLLKGELRQNILDEVESMFHQFLALNSEMENTIKHSGEENKYFLSPIQKIFYKNQIIYSGTQITLNEFYDVDLLKATLKKLINEYSAFRSTMSGDSIIVYRVNEDIEIPYVDISDFSLNEKGYILKYLLQKCFSMPYASNGLLSRVLLIKEDYKNYTVYLPMNHLVYDGFSGDIIHRKIISIYKSLIEHTTYDVCTEEYTKYIQCITKGPVHVSEDEIIQYYNLKMYKKALENNTLSGIDSDSELIFDLNIEHLRNKKEQNYMWKLSLYLIKRLFHDYLNIAEIPLLLFHHGRKSENDTFNQIVGNLLNLIPVLLHEKNADMDHFIESISETMEYTISHNINFPALLEDKNLASQYRSIHELITNHLNNAVIINYHDYVVNEPIHLNENSKALNKDELLGNRMIDIRYNDSYLKLVLNGVSKNEGANLFSLLNQWMDDFTSILAV